MIDSEDDRCGYEGCDRRGVYRLRRSFIGGADLHYACTEHADAIEDHLRAEPHTRYVTVKRTERGPEAIEDPINRLGPGVQREPGGRLHLACVESPELFYQAPAWEGASIEDASDETPAVLLETRDAEGVASVYLDEARARALRDWLDAWLAGRR